MTLESWQLIPAIGRSRISDETYVGELDGRIDIYSSYSSLSSSCWQSKRIYNFLRDHYCSQSLKTPKQTQENGVPSMKHTFTKRFEEPRSWNSSPPSMLSVWERLVIKLRIRCSILCSICFKMRSLVLEVTKGLGTMKSGKSDIMMIYRARFQMN